MVSAFQDWRDKHVYGIDLPLVDKGAQDLTSALHEDIGHPAAAKLVE